MLCQACGRKLTGIRSKLRGYGPTCWAAYLATLSPEERELEEMVGYNWCIAPGAAPNWYLVITPEHEAYPCNPVTGECGCPDALRAISGLKYTCKHVRFMRREINKDSRKRLAQIEKDLERDWPEQ